MRQFDWPTIRAAYERGLTSVEIARTIPDSPSRQAIDKRIVKEGWEVAQREDESVPVTERDIILSETRIGATKEEAAEVAGISRTTLYRWLQDETFATAYRAARTGHILKHKRNIDSAGERDWKASQYILERSPETKEQYSQKQDSGGLTIVLQIDRSEPLLQTALTSDTSTTTPLLESS